MTSKRIAGLFFIGIFFLLIGVWLGTDGQAQLQKKAGETLAALISPTPELDSTQNNTFLSPPPVEESVETYRVTRVIDGDTIEIAGGQTIRYIGIDTPETKHPTKKVQCFGIEAAVINKELVEGKDIRIEKDVSETDRYGRLLRYVYIDDIFVNDYLVRYGYANASSYPPDVRYQDQFRLAQQEAVSENRGLWKEC